MVTEGVGALCQKERVVGGTVYTNGKTVSVAVSLSTQYYNDVILSDLEWHGKQLQRL